MNTEAKTWPCIATAPFGMEGLAAGELKRLGMADVKAETGGARFTAASPEEILRCNLRLRMADRVLIVLAERTCKTFEELFQLVSENPWEHLESPAGK